MLERAEEIWRRGKLRWQVFSGKIGVERLLEAGDVAGYNWIQMNPDMVEGSKNDTTKGQQDGAAAAAGKDGEKGGVV